MTDEQAYEYLLKYETRKTWEQIIKATRRSYEDLKEIYTTAVLMKLRETNEEENYKNLGAKPQKESKRSNLGYAAIRKLQCGEYSVRFYSPDKYIRVKTLEEALKLKEEDGR